MITIQEITVYDAFDNPLTSLVQWDLDVEIFIKDYEHIDSPYGLHFFNSTMSEALSVESTYKSGVLSAKIPNILLTQPYPIIGYVFVTKNNEKKSLYRFRINVVQKPKPSTYIYVDTHDYITLEEVLAECKDYASSAESSKTAAAGSASAAAKSASDASASKTAAASSASAASTSAAAAKTSETNANNSASAASTSAAAAKQSETNAGSSATKADASAKAAAASATEADKNAKLSKSYAVGGTGTRQGEDADNSKYYYEQAKLVSISDDVVRMIMMTGTVHTTLLDDNKGSEIQTRKGEDILAYRKICMGACK